MSKAVKIKRGVDIKLVGEAEKVLVDAPRPKTVAIKPTDFEGIKPKVVVKPGNEVKAGTVLMYDKNHEAVKFTSPVSGEVVEVKRGEKRKLLEIIVLADQETKYEDFGAADPASLDAKQIKEKICASGLWPFIKQRPYDVIANPNDEPKSIFISAFDSAPLAPDNDFILHGEDKLFQKGVDALAKLTKGKIHLTVNGAAKADEVFLNAKNVVRHEVSGPHPAGNVGLHIHNFDPINTGETVWVVKPQDVLAIGRLFESGKFDARRIIALAGAQVKDPKYYRTILGASTKELFEQHTSSDNTRYISGSVLTGTKIDQEGYLGFYDYQLTAIPEGGEPQMFGWITPNPNKFSISRALPSWLQPGKKYNLTADKNGEERPFVVTEEYEKVFPFDIYPVQLLKAIMIEDIELMEELGVYEVAPEDFALCETVCTSKIPSQEIVRNGLNMLRKEMS
ncbi:MAG: NADH:ubiquinone reductase (Na(+)-transporting) subunit A [Flavobacteriales bacterium]|nr:NADH:ubiquinone reductase (Na(+)-transporting) subunit A [Flavobacteriales bacterium]|tara:strand:+ start:43290 stop:44642 length:1353 start_codon:yes stop_codon:yes gene_type:complete